MKRSKDYDEEEYLTKEEPLTPDQWWERIRKIREPKKESVESKTLNLEELALIQEKLK